MKKICKYSFKGSYTVEAAFVIPFVLLIIINMCFFTLSLYSKVYLYASECVEEARNESDIDGALRLSRIVSRELDNKAE